MSSQIFDLSHDLSTALKSVGAIVEQNKESLPIQIQLFADLVLDGVSKTYETRIVVVHRVDNCYLDILGEDIGDCMMADMEYDSVTGNFTSFTWRGHRLSVSKLPREMKTCSICKAEMLVKDFHKHMRDCAGNRFCIICNLFMEGDVNTHQRTCSNRTYDCRICMKQFSTGHGRALHEKKCRKTESTSSRSKKLAQENTILNNTEAIGGTFRVISLLVIPNPDYEGVLDDRRDQIIDILRNCLGRGIKFLSGCRDIYAEDDR